MKTEKTFLSLPIAQFLKIGVAIPLAFLMADLFGNGGLSEMLLWAVLVVVFYTSAHLSMSRYVGMLARRIGQSDVQHWVDVGGVHVGTLSDKEYAAMHLDALRDPRVLAQQIFNIGTCVWKLASHQIVAIPVLFFWLFVVGALSNPEMIPSLVKALSAEGAAKGFTLAPLMTLLALCSVWATFFTVFAGARYGFRNCYMERVQQSVCRRVGITETTDVMVSSKVDKGVEAADAARL